MASRTTREGRTRGLGDVCVCVCICLATVVQAPWIQMFRDSGTLGTAVQGVAQRVGGGDHRAGEATVGLRAPSSGNPRNFSQSSLCHPPPPRPKKEKFQGL